MSDSPAVPDPADLPVSDLRASDADRERVAEILRQAAGEGRLTLDELDDRLETAYAAKTYAQLAPLTRDLPVASAVRPPRPSARDSAAPAPVPLDPRRFGAVPADTMGTAIMGSFTRAGDWVVPRQFTAIAILGGAQIDMRDARFEQQTVTLHLVAIMGGFEVTVPDDANIRVTGMPIMGGFDHAASGGGDPAGPTIIIDGLAFMGGVEVKRKPRRESINQHVNDLFRKVNSLTSCLVGTGLCKNCRVYPIGRGAHARATCVTTLTHGQSGGGHTRPR